MNNHELALLHLAVATVAVREEIPLEDVLPSFEADVRLNLLQNGCTSERADYLLDGCVFEVVRSGPFEPPKTFLNLPLGAAWQALPKDQQTVERYAACLVCLSTAAGVMSDLLPQRMVAQIQQKALAELAHLNDVSEASTQSWAKPVTDFLISLVAAHRAA